MPGGREACSGVPILEGGNQVCIDFGLLNGRTLVPFYKGPAKLWAEPFADLLKIYLLNLIWKAASTHRPVAALNRSDNTWDIFCLQSFLATDRRDSNMSL